MDDNKTWFDKRIRLYSTIFNTIGKHTIVYHIKSYYYNQINSNDACRMGNVEQI